VKTGSSRRLAARRMRVPGITSVGFPPPTIRLTSSLPQLARRPVSAMLIAEHARQRVRADRCAGVSLAVRLAIPSAPFSSCLAQALLCLRPLSHSATSIGVARKQQFTGIIQPQRGRSKRSKEPRGARGLSWRQFLKPMRPPEPACFATSRSRTRRDEACRICQSRASRER
jgi:hypothetical protein